MLAENATGKNTSSYLEVLTFQNASAHVKEKIYFETGKDVIRI